MKYCSDIVYLFIKYVFNVFLKLIFFNYFFIIIFLFLYVYVFFGICIILNNDYFESKICGRNLILSRILGFFFKKLYIYKKKKFLEFGNNGLLFIKVKKIIKFL